MPILRPDYDWYADQSSRLARVATGLSPLDAVHQKIIAEVLLLRLFDLLVGLIASVASKVAQGATYLDGTPGPIQVPRLRSRKAALDGFSNLGRAKAKTQLRWTKPSEIHDNVQFVIAPTDNLRQAITRHAASIDEMRRVRNRIAHNNKTARGHFRLVVQQYYGAALNHVTPGTLLLTTRWAPKPVLLTQYFSRADICAKEIVRT